MFALVDCNNFFASCERVFRPDLNNKPVVVLSNNDGCVIARSNESKALGIPMGAPAFKYKSVFEKNKVHVFSSNYALYGDMSHRVMSMLSEFTPDIEVYSIDESFLKFEGFDYLDLLDYGKTIKKKVDKGTGIPISIGIAPTKALSKVANRIAKKFPKETGGVYVIQNDEQIKKALKWLKIEDVWGIGRKHAQRLQAKQVATALDFINLPDQWVKSNMSIVGLRLKKDLEGQPTLDFEAVKPKKSITTTRTFEAMLHDYQDIKERVTTFAVHCAEKLRQQNSHCAEITVFILTNRHRKELNQYYKSVKLKIEPTSSSIVLTKHAVKALSIIFREGYDYKKAGVIIGKFTPENGKQLSLFSEENPKHIALMQTIDTLNKSIGSNKLKLASQDLGRKWKMKQEKLSPRYTTSLKEIISVTV